MSFPKYEHAIVVGASSGIGAEVARMLAASGCKVAILARRKDKLSALAAEFPGKVLPYVHDVKDVEAVEGLFQQITRDLGGLDLVIYSTGVMPTVGENQYDLAKDQDMVLTNFMGCIAWLNQAALRFGQVEHGTIVGIGSVAGDRGRQGQPVYNASKGAMAIYLEALRNRLAKKGVRVVTIKPGPVATDLLKESNFKNPMPVRVAAEKTLKLSARTGEHYLKFSHRVIFSIIRSIPSFIFRRLKV